MDFVHQFFNPATDQELGIFVETLVNLALEYSDADAGRRDWQGLIYEHWNEVGPEDYLITE